MWAPFSRTMGIRRVFSYSGCITEHWQGRIDDQHFAVRIKRSITYVNPVGRGIDDQHFAVCLKKQSPFCLKSRLPISMSILGGLTIKILQSTWKGDCLCAITFSSEEAITFVDPGGRSTIDIERINSQHFTVHLNCQSPIIDPLGGAENYGVVTSGVNNCNLIRLFWYFDWI